MITYPHLLEACRLVVEALQTGGHAVVFVPESLTLTIDEVVYRFYIRSDPNWSAGRNHREEQVLKVGRPYDDPALNALTLLHEIGHHLNGDVARGGKPKGPDAARRLLTVEIRAWQRALDLFTEAHGQPPTEALEGAAQALSSYFTDLEPEGIACALLFAMMPFMPPVEPPAPLADTPFDLRRPSAACASLPRMLY